jgi:phosphohistidine phosphatase SixA
MRDQLIGERRAVMLVGHMPNLARLLRLMIEGDADAGTVGFPLHGVVALESEGERWREKWRIGP